MGIISPLESSETRGEESKNQKPSLPSCCPGQKLCKAIAVQGPNQ